MSENLLHKAVKNNNLDDVISMLSQASIHGDPSIADFLLAYGADVNAGFPRNSKVCLKGTNSAGWFNYFGGNITLLTYAILERKEELAKCFIDHGANIKDADNKTLLMRALENDDYQLAQWIALKFKDHSELINAHDNCGFHSKALQNTRLPTGDLCRYFRSWSEGSHRIDPRSWNILKNQRKLTTYWILLDLVNRRTLSLYIPKEKKKLMDQLLKEDHEIRKTLEEYENSFLRGYLKNNIIDLGDKKITIYEFAEKILNNRRVIGFLKNYGYHTIKIDLETYFHDPCHLRSLLEFKVDSAWKRSFLLEKIKTLPQLKEYIPLPYELILEIIDYLNNDDLQRFIDSFHCT
ncbi:hypothetical protein KQX54_005997 [Cotesia glomerata]|uniref:Ankyrin repeat protein n=1 Tax=Cotesia glomerata TaxID=32391 RepID=A0AAV7HS13_COTGL|nr:hypothetical protein KQX54_005997 [Cotesia glomerata]